MTNGKHNYGDDLKGWDDDITKSSKHAVTNDFVDDTDNHGHSNRAVMASSWHSFVHSWRLWVAVAIIVVAVVLPVIWVEAVRPAIDRRKVASDPAVQWSTAAILPYDHAWVKTPLSKNSVDDANVNEYQMMLKQKSSEAGNTSCFVFHAEGKDSPKNTVKVTGALSDPKTRDFFNAQQHVLETMMRNGKVKVEVCMLLTDDEYSAIATEALGEIDYNNPANTWKGLMGLLRVDSSGLKTGDARLGAVMNVVNSLPNADSKVTIRKESLKNGSFLQWARVMTNANSVEKIPALWINKTNYSNNDKYRITNPDWMFNQLNALK